jgi:transposase
MLARMGALLELQTRPPRSEALLELKELHLAREALAKDRTAAKNRRNALTAPLLKRQNAQRLEQIERQMAAIESAILEQIHTDPDLSRRFAILTTIPGVSALTAFALLIEMPELGNAGARRPRCGTGGQSRRPGPGRPAVRPMDWTRLHPRRTSPSPPGRLHAGARRDPIQSGHEGNL